MLKRLFCLPAILIFVLAAGAQDRNAAKRHLDTLCSDYMAGRGYVNNGAIKASVYIAAEFKKYGLQPIGTKQYYQSYKFPVNLFPTVLFNAGGVLEPGLDYIPDPSSPGALGLHKIVKLKPEHVYQMKQLAANTEKEYFKAVVVIHDSLLRKMEKPELLFKANILHAYAYAIEVPGNLVWSVSTRRSNLPVFRVKEGVLDSVSTAFLAIDAVYKNKQTQRNVMGYVKGNLYPDSFILVTAHYDHLGQLGQAVYRGANDNASGVAMMLDMASYYAAHPEQARYSMAFVAFSGEEAGLLGSKYFVEHPTIPLKQISFVLNLDLMATGDEGLTVVNGQVFTEQFKTLTSINDSLKLLPAINSRGKAANSDHYWFTEAGIPSFFIYLNGKYPWYHHPGDSPDKVEFPKYDEVFRLYQEFLDALQKRR